MTGYMFIDNRRVEFCVCDSRDHELRFATQRLGWSAHVQADYCNECAAVWRAYAAELGGEVIAEPLQVPTVLKSGAA